MTLEEQLVEQRTRSADKIGIGVHVVDNKIIRKKRCGLTKRRKQAPSTAAAATATVPVMLQKLFVSCQEVFKGPGTTPRPSDVQKLRCILGTYVLSF